MLTEIRLVLASCGELMWGSVGMGCEMKKYFKIKSFWYFNIKYWDEGKLCSTCPENDSQMHHTSHYIGLR